MNPTVLGQFKANIDDACVRLKEQFRVFRVDTSQPGSEKRKTAEQVAMIALDLISEQLNEEILCLGRSEIGSLFKGKTTLHEREARQIVEAFIEKGSYIPRADAESSPDHVQALPITVVRTKSGQVLLLRRREKAEGNPLHNRVVLWAGGHVRKEDSANGHSVLQGAVRELHEELRLSVESKALRLLGAIHADLGGSTSKHVAIVYEWRAETDDVAIALSNAEFFERRGTSLSGRFVAPEDLINRLRVGSESGQVEPWSEQILRHLLGQEGQLAEMTLL